MFVPAHPCELAVTQETLNTHNFRIDEYLAPIVHGAARR